MEQSSKDLRVPSEHAGRLDAYLLGAIGTEYSLSRSQIKKLIEQGFVLVEGTPAKKAGLELSGGESIRVTHLKPQSPKIEPHPLSLRILHEDEDLIVIDKPSGLSMHPGAGNRTKTLLNALAAHGGQGYFESGERPGIVHRLDKDTTGVVVVAKSVSVQNDLAQQFSSRQVERAYKALVLCTPRAQRVVRTVDSGVITTYMGRDPHRPTAMAVLPDSGREAVTHWKVLERMHYAALLEVKLGTGRTHQIRVHMNHLGCPVLGDRLYGDFSALPAGFRRAQEQFGRQALHAFRLGFVHPKTRALLNFESPLPQDFASLVDTFRGN